MSGVLHFDTDQEALSLEAQSDPSLFYAVPLGTLVLVQGRVRLFRDAPELLVQQFAPCGDPNALTAHWLCAIKLYETYYKRLPELTIDTTTALAPPECCDAPSAPLASLARCLYQRLYAGLTNTTTPLPDPARPPLLASSSGNAAMSLQPAPLSAVDRMRKLARRTTLTPFPEAIVHPSDNTAAFPLHPYAVPFVSLLNDSSVQSAARAAAVVQAENIQMHENRAAVQAIQDVLAGMTRDGIIAKDLVSDAYIALDVLRVLVPAVYAVMRRLAGREHREGGAVSAEDSTASAAGGELFAGMYVSRIVQALHAEPFLERVHEVRVREALSVLAEQGIICQSSMSPRNRVRKEAIVFADVALLSQSRSSHSSPEEAGDRAREAQAWHTHSARTQTKTPQSLPFCCCGVGNGRMVGETRLSPERWNRGANRRPALAATCALLSPAESRWKNPAPRTNRRRDQCDPPPAHIGKLLSLSGSNMSARSPKRSGSRQRASASAGPSHFLLQ